MSNHYIQETSSGTREIAVESELLTERRLFITGPITLETALMFVQAMLHLMKSSEPIYIFISSPGGDVNAGLIMYDIIQGCKNEIYIYCVGQAYSMAAWILAGGQKGRRFILPHSQVMIHEAMLGVGAGGTAGSFRNIAERLNELQEQLNGILSKHTGRSLEDIIRDVAFDNFMSAEKAVELGFCDAIVTDLQAI